MKNTEQSLFLSTGELSKQLNISIRTLRYYDQIGLVQPSRKAPGGRRAYSREDILNLQKVLLKSLNLSLEDSQSILAEHSMSPILTAHRAILSDEIQQLESSLDHACIKKPIS